MSKVKLAAAQAYIEAKEYNLAREILSTVNQPTASHLLEQLDQIDPVNTQNRLNITPDIGMAARFKSYIPHFLVTIIMLLLFLSRAVVNI